MGNRKNNLSQKLTKQRAWFKITVSYFKPCRKFKHKKKVATEFKKEYNYIMKTKKELEREIQVWLKARKQVRVGSRLYFTISSRIHKLKIKLEGK